MNQEIQNNFIVKPFKANLIMGKNFSDLQKFSTDCLAYCLIGLPSSKARKKA